MVERKGIENQCKQLIGLRLSADPPLRTPKRTPTYSCWTSTPEDAHYLVRIQRATRLVAHAAVLALDP